MTGNTTEHATAGATLFLDFAIDADGLEHLRIDMAATLDSAMTTVESGSFAGEYYDGGWGVFGTNPTSRTASATIDVGGVALDVMFNLSSSTVFLGNVSSNTSLSLSSSHSSTVDQAIEIRRDRNHSLLANTIRTKAHSARAPTIMRSATCAITTSSTPGRRGTSTSPSRASRPRPHARTSTAACPASTTLARSATTTSMAFRRS